MEHILEFWESTFSQQNNCVFFPTNKFSEKEIQTVIDINVTGVVKTIQASIPVMRKQNSGGITILSSVLGRMGEEWFPVYSGTKWAVIGLAKISEPSFNLTLHFSFEKSDTCPPKVLFSPINSATKELTGSS